MTEENTQLQNPSPEEAPEPLIFTDACVAKVKELLAAEEDPNMPLRVFVQGGGCQGFQYGFQFEEDLEGSQFVIRNPNAVTSCSCGSSFSV